MQNIAIIFLSWYYLVAPKKILTTWRNVLKFAWNFFSVELLLRTLFAPWKRDITKPTGSGFDPKALVDSLVINLISRLLGATVRFWVILLGLILEILIIILGLAFFIFWLMLPLLIIWGIVRAIRLFSV